MTTRPTDPNASDEFVLRQAGAMSFDFMNGDAHFAREFVDAFPERAEKAHARMTRVDAKCAKQVISHAERKAIEAVAGPPKALVKEWGKTQRQGRDEAQGWEPSPDLHVVPEHSVVLPTCRQYGVPLGVAEDMDEAQRLVVAGTLHKFLEQTPEQAASDDHEPAPFATKIDEDFAAYEFVELRGPKDVVERLLSQILTRIG